MKLAYTKTNVLRLLIILAMEGALDKTISLTTSQLADKLDVSQQTASRWLEELYNDKYIDKNQIGQGLAIQITKEGRNILWKTYTDLQGIFHEVPHQIKGQLARGLGEGGYYINLEGYMSQFENVLKWKPFAGTLNIRLVTEEDIDAFQSLLKAQYHTIEGFFHEETKRTLGKVFLWECEIKYTKSLSTKGAIIYPDRTHHQKTIMEVLAPFSVRNEWNLQDGDALIINPKNQL
jgi:riboflavin kinase